MKRTLMMIAALLGLASACWAQSAGFGSISGSVTDKTGAVVPDAKVLVENSSKGIKRELATSGAGGFSADALVPASGYVVTIRKDGFSLYIVKNITVVVGENVSLNIPLTVASEGAKVEVTGEAPIVDLTKTETSTVVGSDQIMNLPINGRRVDSFVLLNPAVTSDGTFGLLSFRGNPGGNIFLTDGNDTTNAYYNENAGRTRSYNISQDAVQEFQVLTSNFKAEYGRAMGGVVNTVTRSGSNAVHGSAYEFFRNRTLNATDPTTKNALYPNGINPPEWRHQAGLSIGGPIVKDKLFYFFNGELMRRNDPIVSSNIGAGAGNYLFNGDATTKATCYTGALDATHKLNVTSAQCAAALAFLKSRALPQQVTRKVDNNLLFGKIDYRPNAKDSFSVSTNYVDWRSPNGIQTQVSLTNGSGIGNNADSNVFDRTVRASWTRVLSPVSINEFRYGLFKDRQFDPASASLLPSFNGVASPIGLTVNSVSNLGYATNYPRTNPNEIRNTLSDTVSWSLGRHNLKGGVDWARTTDHVVTLYNQYGSYTYKGLYGNSDITNFAADFSNNTTGVGHYSSYSQAFGNPKVDLTLNEVALFGQDEWHPTNKLTVDYGVRGDYSKLPQPTICNQTYTKTCHIPGSGWRWAPRVGLAYALNGKTTVRAGYGLFNSRYITASIENLMVTNATYQKSYTFYNNTQGAPLFPISASAPPNTTLMPTVMYAADNFRNPYSEQAELAIERQIAKNTSLSVSYVWSRALHLLQSKDTNLSAPNAATKGYWYMCSNTNCSNLGSGSTPFYSAPLVTSRASSYTGAIYELDSAGNSYYNALMVSLQRRYSSWFTGAVNYTYSHAIDDNQSGAATFGNAYPTSVWNGDYASERGTSSLDQRHRLVINGVLQPIFTRSNTWMARQIINGWQLSFVEMIASPQYQIATVYVQDSYSGKANGANFSAGTYDGYTMNGVGGSSRIPWMSTSMAANRIGNVFRTDIRLGKQFTWNERVKVLFSLEAVNLFNHTIPSGRNVQRYTAEKCSTALGATSSVCSSLPADANGSKYVVVPYTGFDTITATQVTPDGTTARRAQASVRINF